MKLSTISSHYNNRPKLKKAAGFSLPGAIFILVALSVIGVAMISLNAGTATTSALNVLQSRAWYAAYSGAEWGISKVVNNDNSYSVNNNSCEGIDGQSFILDNFNLSVSCSSNCTSPVSCCHSLSECQLAPRMSEITVTAGSGNNGETYRVRRTIQASISYDGT